MSAHHVSRTVVVAALVGVIGITPMLTPASADTSIGEVSVPRSALNSLIGEQDRHFHRAADLYAKGDTERSGIGDPGCGGTDSH